MLKASNLLIKGAHAQTTLPRFTWGSGFTRLLRNQANTNPDVLEATHSNIAG